MRAAPHRAARPVGRVRHAPAALTLPQRPEAFILTLFGMAFGLTAALALLPADLVADEYGFVVSLAVMISTLLVAGRAASHFMPDVPMRQGLVVFVFLAKLALGLWYWDTFHYSIDDQSPRAALAESEIYGERRSDTAVVDELLRLFSVGGVRYVSESEAYIPINRRAPAHLVAIVVRAFGGQYAAYFPFVALLVAMGSFCSIAAMAALGVGGSDFEWGSRLAVLWPAGMEVCSVTKDSALLAAVAMCGALLTVGDSRARRLPWGVLLAGALLPLFRPVYLIVCVVPALLWLLRSRTGLAIRLAAGIPLVAAAVFYVALSSFREDVAAYQSVETNPSPVLRIPVLGRIVFALATPFPWTQVADGWWKYNYVFFFAMQVLILAMLILAASRVRSLADWRRLDSGAAMGLLMSIGGALSPVVQPGYVHVGVIALLPFMMKASGGFYWKAVAIALAVFLVGNVLWILRG